MNFTQKLEYRISGDVNSLLGIGIDPIFDISEISRNKSTNLCQTIYKECCELIDNTKNVAAIYKPNIAFFEALGGDGYNVLESVISHIPSSIPIILDAKRGDIGNTAKMYAAAYYDRLEVDAVTVSPYMGMDSIQPFIENPRKAAFVLCKTSNDGSRDVQCRTIKEGEEEKRVYMHVAKMCKEFIERGKAEGKENGEIGLVMGALDCEAIRTVRKEWEDVWLLTPGVGAQGGVVEDVVEAGIRRDGSGVIIPISRAIYKSEDKRKSAEAFHASINAARSSLKNSKI